MLVTFVASAYLTLILVIVCYGCGYNEEVLSNPIDAAIVQRTKRWPVLRAIYLSRLNWKTLLEKTILMYSDQQLVTGLAILISGYSQLSSSTGDMTSYHWQLMVYTAWFASLTHLTTLTILRKYFRDIKKVRIWRIGLMTLLMLLLMVALLPTGNSYWLVLLGVPARCFFPPIARKASYVSLGSGFSFSGSFISMLFSLVLISVSHITRAIRVSKRASFQSQRWLRQKPLGFLESLAHRHFEQVDNGALRYVLLSIVFTLLLAILDVFASLAWEVSLQWPHGKE